MISGIAFHTTIITEIFFSGIPYVWNLNMQKKISYGYSQIENQIIGNSQDN